MTLRGSLRGENKVRRYAGAGSSPAPSARSERTRLWQRLRKYDRKITQLDREIQLARWRNVYIGKNSWPLDELEKRRAKWDAKRRSVRRRLKGYE